MILEARRHPLTPAPTVRFSATRARHHMCRCAEPVEPLIAAVARQRGCAVVMLRELRQVCLSLTLPSKDHRRTPLWQPQLYPSHQHPAHAVLRQYLPLKRTGSPDRRSFLTGRPYHSGPEPVDKSAERPESDRPSQQTANRYKVSARSAISVTIARRRRRPPGAATAFARRGECRHEPLGGNACREEI